MSGYKTFAVAGPGGLGSLIAEALLEKKNSGLITSVLVLSRSANKYDGLVAKGVKVVTVDYTSVSSLQSAVSGIDVVISTVSGYKSDESQETLALASKAAGVKLFVPSEFGGPTDDATEGIWGIRNAFRKKLQDEIKLPYAAYFTGAFPDWFFKRGIAETLGFDLVNGKITIPGDGNDPISWTLKPDVARFVVHSLTALPKEKIEWRIFRIEGDRISISKVVDDWRARSGKTVTVTHRPRSEVEDYIKKNPNDLAAIIFGLMLEWETGKGVVGKPEQLSNGYFPEWNPKKALDYLLEAYGQ